MGMTLPKSEHWAWDIESAEGGQIVDYPTMLSCSNADHTFVAIGSENIRSLATALVNSGAELYTWNGYKFDIPVMKRWGVEFPQGVDGMYLAYLDDETQSLSLESCSMKYLGAKGWKHGDWKTFDPNSKEAAEYAAKDAKLTLRLCLKLIELLGPRKKVLDRILRPARAAFDEIESRGIWIDPRAVDREKQSALSLREHSLRQIQTLCGKEFNPGSTRQVANYLLGKGYKLPTTESGNPSVAEAVLNGLKGDKEGFIDSLLTYRGATKTLSTYVKPYEEIAKSEEGRVHPEYTLVRTLTGRSSARNTNVQNLPREYKDFFGARPGNVFVEVDYSAIEFRIAGWVAKEPLILKNYAENPDWDPHRFFASLFYGKEASEVTKEERQIAKSANFGLLYLGNGHTLMNYAKKTGVSLTLWQGEQLYKFFHQTYTGFAKLYLETKNEIISTGQCVCPTGHIRHFGDFNLMADHLKKEALNQAVNAKVQNMAAHLAYIALIKLTELGMPVTGFVHDAFLFEFETKEEAEAKLPMIEWAMTQWPVDFLAKEFGVNLDIPLRTESKVREYETVSI